MTSESVLPTLSASPVMMFPLIPIIAAGGAGLLLLCCLVIAVVSIIIVVSKRRRKEPSITSYGMNIELENTAYGDVATNTGNALYCKN